jgi:dipeptidyl aminopeptidase/acylaminoacyl peptidase
MIKTINNLLKLTGVFMIPVFIVTPHTFAQENLPYKKPPQEITNIIENSVNRNVVISGKGNFMAVLQKPAYSSIKELSSPLLKLAGLRINPANNTNIQSSYYADFYIKNINTAEEFKISGLPKDALIGNLSFSPDENRIAFSLKRDKTVQLWVAYLPTKEAQRLSNFSLNDTYGKVYEWASHGETILAKFIVDNRRELVINDIPSGPVIMENLGKTGISKSHPDLLKNPTDELLFDYYLSSQLKIVYLNGMVVNFNRPGIYKDFNFSPDGNMVMVSTIEKPYSYTVPIDRFPYHTEIFDKYGKLVKKLSQTPLSDLLPAGFDAVIKGPREYQWRSDKPQTYIWVEAQDEGDPSKRFSIRDIIYMQEVGSDRVSKLAQCYLRFHSIVWGDDQIALVTERWFKTRGERRVFIKPSNPAYRVNLWDRYYEDRYSDPGKFATVKNEFNRDVLLLSYNQLRRVADPNNVNIFSVSEGASPYGDQPFILQFNVKTKLTDTIFRSKAPYYEKPLFFDNKEKLIISRESESEPANYFALDINGKRGKQLTYFPNPNLESLSVLKKQLTYKRSDNLMLSSTIYIPKKHAQGQGKLPVLMWTQPTGYKTNAAAGQVKGSPYQFIDVGWNSPLFWVTQGFIVMDNMAMPIVGESNDNPNDTFVAQLKDNASAAIKKLNEIGIADTKRIAIGGHGSGAFLTANLLAHTHLFTAAIARSGSYNRSLDAFGFQYEERTLWESPEVYQQLSPLNYADKIKAPTLLIHGEEDDQPETPALQSERFYNALTAHGTTSRLVILPKEAHNYTTKESVLHMLWEMDNWLKTYLQDKNNAMHTTINN